MKKSVIIFYIVFLPVLVFADNMAFPFYREAFDGKTTDKMSGVLYFKDAPAKEEKGIYFYVTSPVKQIITYNQKETYIYYPEEKKAFIMTEDTKSPVNINPFENASKKIDLTAFGLVLIKKEKNSSGTKELWAPKNMAAVLVKDMTMYKDKQDRLKKMEMTQKNGKLLLRIIYDNYIIIKDKRFPLYIETYSAGDKVAYQEKIILTMPELKAKLPDIINNFKLPADVTVKKVKM